MNIHNTLVLNVIRPALLKAIETFGWIILVGYRAYDFKHPPTPRQGNSEHLPQESQVSNLPAVSADPAPLPKRRKSVGRGPSTPRITTQTFVGVRSFVDSTAKKPEPLRWAIALNPRAIFWTVRPHPIKSLTAAARQNEICHKFLRHK